MQGEGNSQSKCASYTRSWLAKYDSIRGKRRADFEFAFWDIVVITTADEEQREAYQLQLDDKLSRNELPRDVDYHIIADIPGPKLGNGGSTLTALDHLEEKYGEQLFHSTVLLLHAGGQSQRMPSASVLGKVFTALPFGDPMYQMLDLKLANSIPLLRNMKPGFLLVCADDIQIFNVAGEEGSLRMDQEGFTALAHPGTMAVGTCHGVYVIAGQTLLSDQLVQTSQCLEVLQKPTYERMEKRKAILKVKTNCRSQTNVCNNVTSSELSSEPTVYTDSCFYFDSENGKKLLKFYRDNKPLRCEIDAYGDFLQSLGPDASIDYVNLMGNVSKITPDLIPMRKKVYELLRGTPIHVLALNQSKYIHIGTTKELLFHFCEDRELGQELGISCDVSNKWLDVQASGESHGGKVQKLEPQLRGCVMHSVLPLSSRIAARSIVEFCNFEIPLVLGKNSMLSNCEVCSDVDDESSLVIPADVFIHTAAIKGASGETHYATIVFDIYENLKKKAEGKKAFSQLQYLKSTVDEAISLLNFDITKVLPSDETNYTLWSARLFPVTKSMSQSLLTALKMLSAVQSGKPCGLDLSSHSLVSMADILDNKDIGDMLKYRKTLYANIHSL